MGDEWTARLEPGPSAAGAGASPRATSASTPWLAVGLATTMIAATAPQFALGAFGPRIAADIGLTVSDIGLVVGTLFCLSVPVSLVAGRIIRRIGPRRGLAVVLTAATAATTLTVTAGSRAALLVAVVPASLAMASCTPVTNRLAREAPRLATRNLLVSVAQTGVQLGAVVVGALGLAGAQVPWQRLFAAIFAAILVAAVSTAAAHRDRPSSVAAGFTPAGAHASSVALPPSPSGQTVDVDARRASLDTDPGPLERFPVALLTSFALLMALPGGTTIAYLATFTAQDVGLSSSRASGTALVFGAAALLGRASLGRFLRSDGAILTTLAAMAVGGATAIALVGLAPEAPSLVWVAAALFGVTGLTWPAVVMIAVVRRTTATRTASTTGTILAAFYLGQWIGPMIAAALLARGVGFGVVWMASAGLYLCGLGPVMLARATARTRTSSTSEV